MLALSLLFLPPPIRPAFQMSRSLEGVMGGQNNKRSMILRILARVFGSLHLPLHLTAHRSARSHLRPWVWAFACIDVGSPQYYFFFSVVFECKFSFSLCFRCACVSGIALLLARGGCLIPAIKGGSAMLGCKHRAATLSHDLDNPWSFFLEDSIITPGEEK